MQIYGLGVVEVPTNRPWPEKTTMTRSTAPRARSSEGVLTSIKEAHGSASRSWWGRPRSRSQNFCRRC